MIPTNKLTNLVNEMAVIGVYYSDQVNKTRLPILLSIRNWLVFDLVSALLFMSITVFLQMFQDTHQHYMGLLH